MKKRTFVSAECHAGLDSVPQALRTQGRAGRQGSTAYTLAPRAASFDANEKTIVEPSSP
jgi:hypothetical protein